MIVELEEVKKMYAEMNYVSKHGGDQVKEQFSKVYPEFKIVSPRLVKVNVKTDDGRLILDVYRNGKFCKTVTIVAEGERAA